MNCRIKFKPLIILSFLLISGLLSPLALAFNEDSKQPINISANRAEGDEKKGITRYIGDVKIIQGSLTIKADEVTIGIIKDKVSHLIAIGNPASFQQQNSEQGLVVASAKRITYYIKAGHLQLAGAAKIDQPQASVSGEQIDYYTNEQRVTAVGDKEQNSNNPNGNSRVKVVIPPIE